MTRPFAHIPDRLREALPDGAVVTGDDCAAWSHDWMREYSWTPLCVVRPASTEQVSAVLTIASEAGCPVVPVAGNTGLTGATRADGAIMLSLDRMSTVREVRPDAKLAIVEAGAILSDIHAAAAEHGLSFPVTFGAKGSARIGGILATNAGGSNVVRYGNTRDLVLGLEVVMADGRVMNLMSELHKDNSGYDLRHLMIGSEGTLGVITGAVLKLVPQPRAYATALLSVPGFDQALLLLNRLQKATDGAVEAFEYMSARHMQEYAGLYPDRPKLMDDPNGVVLMVELGATAERDVVPGPDGAVPLVAYFEEVLGELLEEGALTDAVLAQNEAQRRAMWEMREAYAEVVILYKPMVNHDVAVPLDKVSVFLERMAKRLAQLDPGAATVVCSHLGDGNVHYPVWPSRDDPVLLKAITRAVEDEVLQLGGSFSAEHGIGTSKLSAMASHKDGVAVDVMRAIKQALDPEGILNPGKVLPAVDASRVQKT